MKYGKDAKINNTIEYDNIKDIKIESLLCKHSDRILPKYIYEKKNSFYIQIKYKKNIYKSKEDNIEKGIDKIKEFENTINISKFFQSVHMYSTLACSQWLSACACVNYHKVLLEMKKV